MSFFTEEELKESAERSQFKASPEYGYLQSVAKINQKEAARTLGVSTHSGIDAASIYNNPKLQVQNLIRPDEFIKLGFTNPQVKQFLEDPIHLGIARDNSSIKLLTDIDDGFKEWKAFKNGVKTVFSNAFNYLDMIGRSRNRGLIDDLEESGFYADDPVKKQDLINKINNMADKPTTWSDVANSETLKREEIKAESDLESYYLALIEQAPQFASQILVAATGGAPVAGAYMFTQISGGTYGQLQSQGVDPERASTAGMVNAALQAPLESLPIYKLFKPGAPFVKIGGSKTNRLVEQTLTESLTEFIQQYPEAAVDIWAKTEGMDKVDRAKIFLANIKEITGDALFSGAVAAPFGFLGGVGRISFERNVEKKLHQEEMQSTEKRIEQIKNSELSKLSPEIVERFINSQEETIYVDAEAALKLYQSGKDNLLKELQISQEELVEAAAKNEMLPIPKGTYEIAAAKDSALHEGLKNDISFDENNLTSNKINYLNEKDVKQATQEVLKEKNLVANERNAIYKQMRQTGINPDVARSAVTALESHAQVMADYEGVSKSQWLKENAPKFVKDTKNIVYTQKDRRLEQDIQNFSKQLDDWQQGKNDKRKPLSIGRTPMVLQKLGAKDLPLEISQKVIDKIVLSKESKKGKHDLGLDILKQLPKQLNEPVMVFKSKTKSDSLVALTELFDKNNKGIIVAVHMDVQHKTRIVNAVASMYGRNDVKKFVKGQTPVYMNKKKSRDWLHSGQLQLLPRVAQPNSNVIVSEKTDADNHKNSFGNEC